MSQAAYQFITSHLDGGEWIETRGTALYWDLSSAILPPAVIWVSPWSSLKIQCFKFFISPFEVGARRKRWCYHFAAPSLSLSLALLSFSLSLALSLSRSALFSLPTPNPLLLFPHSDVLWSVRLNFKFVRSPLSPRRDNVGGQWEALWGWEWEGEERLHPRDVNTVL